MFHLLKEKIVLEFILTSQLKVQTVATIDNSLLYFLCGCNLGELIKGNIMHIPFKQIHSECLKM